MRAPRAVVVTGMGVVSPLGTTPASMFAALCDGRTGITRHPDPAITRCVGVADVDPSVHFSQRMLDCCDRATLLAVIAAQQAGNAAALHDEALRERCGVFIGTGIGGVGSLVEGVLSFHGLIRKGPKLIIPAAMPNAIAAHIAMQLKTRAEAQTYATACTAGAVALGEAFRRVRDGYLDIALCGASESMLTPELIGAWQQARVLCDEPPEAPHTGCRPFSAARTGITVGEGAAIFCIEHLDHALARGAVPLAELAGYGTSNDSTHLAKPDASGQALAIERALVDAGIGPGAIGYVNAHATGTRSGDAAETQALKLALGSHAARIPVSSTKGATGHLIGAAGALEFAICVQALQQQRVPPTLYFDGLDPHCDLDHVPDCTRPVDGLDYVLSNSFGMGGNNTSLIVRGITL